MKTAMHKNEPSKSTKRQSGNPGEICNRQTPQAKEIMGSKTGNKPMVPLSDAKRQADAILQAGSRSGSRCLSSAGGRRKVRAPQDRMPANSRAP